MKYRILGSTGIKVSVIGVGTWQYGGEWGMRFTQEMADPILGPRQRAGHQPDRHRRVLRRPLLRIAGRPLPARAAPAVDASPPSLAISSTAISSAPITGMPKA